MPEFCPMCGAGQLRQAERNRRISVNGNELVITGDKVSECLACGEQFYTGEQAKVADKRLVEARRSAESLLSGDEIRRIRQSLMLTQSQLESALGVGPKTVVRWESASAVQSKALDDVLRLISLDPDNLRLLVRVRNAAMIGQVEDRLLPEDEKKDGDLRTAIFAGIENARVDLEPDQANQVTRAVLSAIKEHRQSKIEQLANEARLAV